MSPKAKSNDIDIEMVALAKRMLADAPRTTKVQVGLNTLNDIAAATGLAKHVIVAIKEGRTYKYIDPAPRVVPAPAPEDHPEPDLPPIYLIKQSFALNADHPSFVVWSNHRKMDATVPSLCSTYRYCLVGTIAIHVDDVIYALSFNEWSPTAKAYDVRADKVHIHRTSYEHAMHWMHKNTFEPEQPELPDCMGNVPTATISPAAVQHHANAALVEDKPSTALSAA